MLYGKLFTLLSTRPNTGLMLCDFEKILQKILES